jgi:hypothetical protein
VGNIKGANVNATGLMSAVGNVYAANMSVSGNINIGTALAATVDDAVALAIALG